MDSCFFDHKNFQVALSPVKYTRRLFAFRSAPSHITSAFLSIPSIFHLSATDSDPIELEYLHAQDQILNEQHLMVKSKFMNEVASEFAFNAWKSTNHIYTGIATEMAHPNFNFVQNSQLANLKCFNAPATTLWHGE